MINKIKHKLRKFLGIEDDVKRLNMSIILMGKAINKTFHLKERDNDIFKRMGLISFMESDKKYFRGKE